MRATITIQKTPQGLLIPRSALGNWKDKDLEAVWKKQGIIIRPKSTASDSQTQVRQVLRKAKMLYEPNWETPPPVTQEERARLAKKLSRGGPLSDVIIVDREDRV
jgi:hypothetical protein